MNMFTQMKKSMSNLDYSKTKIKLCRDTYDKLIQELGRNPLTEEVAEDTGLDVEEVRDLLNYKIEEDEPVDSDFQLRFKMTIKNHELEKARLKAGLQQSQLGEKIGLAGTTISQIECCRQYPTIENQKKIAKVFGMQVETLFPEWLEVFSKKWNDAEKSRIVPVNLLQINSPELLALPSGDYEEMQRVAENAIAKKILADVAMDVLTEREIKVLDMRFGMNNGYTQTIEEVGKEFGLSRERICQIEAKAIEKLRTDPRTQNLNK